ncbi:MAG: glycoside hydrolase family 99-like domain-containing protein, partial [Clostridia bacterium]|nr:glycoside hydrolase family 99-like domain-containing protein [Clostridia bacterium]
YITVKGNLDTGRADFYVNSQVVSSFDITDTAESITKYIIGTTDEAKLNLTLKKVQLYSGYLVRDIFASSPVDTVPTDWITNGASVKYAGGIGQSYDKNSMGMTANAGVNTYAKKYFEAASGKLVLEAYIHTPAAVSGVYVSAKCGDTDVVKVVTDGNKFVASTGEALRTYRDNIWQCIRIEADTASQKAVIKIDGKKVAEVAFANAASYLDNIEIGATPSANTTLTFDDVTVYTMHDYADYVPVPVPAVSEGYDIGVQVCSLWRNGYHSGWDTISNFAELEPVLGYYDEGLVETADWEIKMMVEHGIDFQHYCWYCPSTDIKEPIKSPGLFESLHDGYFNAKYSDMIKFNLMWENGNGNLKTGGLEAFKEFIWPYWLEYYFSDPRYMTVDNKILLTVWSYPHFIEDFGGTEGASKAVEFMNNDLKNYGFDGIVVLFHDAHNMSKSVFETMKAAGAHGTYSYNLNRTGDDPEYQIERHKTQRATGVLHNTANIGVGFNDVGWNKNREPLITTADYEKVALFMRDTYLKETEGDGTPWHSSLVFLSTWNEYGEGHY